MLIVVLGFIAFVFGVAVLDKSSDCTKLNDKNREQVDAFKKMVFETDTKALTDSQHDEYIKIMDGWSTAIRDSQSLWESKCS